MDTIISLIVAAISQCTHVSNRHLEQLKHTQFLFVSYVSVKQETIILENYEDFHFYTKLLYRILFQKGLKVQSAVCRSPAEADCSWLMLPPLSFQKNLPHAFSPAQRSAFLHFIHEVLYVC